MSHEKVFYVQNPLKRYKNHFLNRMIMSSTRLKNKPHHNSHLETQNKFSTFVDFAKKVLSQTEKHLIFNQLATWEFLMIRSLYKPKLVVHLPPPHLFFLFFLLVNLCVELQMAFFAPSATKICRALMKTKRAERQKESLLSLEKRGLNFFLLNLYINVEQSKLICII